MNYNLEIQLLLLKSENLSEAEDKITLLEQAIQIADSNNDIDGGFELRFLLITTEQIIAKSQKSIIAFSWILEMFDSYPDRLPPSKILEEYKNLINSVIVNPDITKIQLENIFEDFRRRCLNTKLSLHEYYNILSNYYLFIGNKSKARECVNQRDTESPNEFTNWIFDQLITIYIEIFENKFDEAILHVNEMHKIATSIPLISCILHSSLVYNLGYKAEDKRANLFFEKVDKSLFSESPFTWNLYYVALLLHYMSLHKKEKAWLYFEKYVNIVPKVGQIIQFFFATAVLPLFYADKTHLLAYISKKQHFYREDNTYKSRYLYNYYFNVANDLAHKFDTRNETNHFSNQLQFMLNKINQQ